MPFHVSFQKEICQPTSPLALLLRADVNTRIKLAAPSLCQESVILLARLRRFICRRMLVDWIKVDVKFKAIYGTDGKMKIGGPPKQTKAAAFGDMADYLFANPSRRELPRLTGKQLQNRWRTS